MSIWGKVIGGVAGFALGGPLGAIMGAVAGHQYDKIKARETGQGPSTFTGFGPDARQVAFTTAIIVLSAKMAKADGVVTRDEIAAFKQLFQIPPSESGDVARIWDEAKRDAQGYEPYARQIASLFRNEPNVLEELLGALFHIAQADGVVHPNELRMLRDVAKMFGFSDQGFERLYHIYMGPEKDTGPDPYEVLDIDPGASDDEVKKRYRQLTRENHPDVLMAKGVPQEFIDLANEKMAAINAAYDQVAKQRGIK